MNTSKKILIGLGVVVALVIIWETYCILSETSIPETDEDDAGITDADDYNSYIASIEKGAKGSTQKKTVTKSLLPPAITNWFKEKIAPLLGTAATRVPVSGGNGTSSASASSGTKTGFASSCFPIKWGSSNEAVKQLQTWLNRFLGTNIDTDGIYGKETNNALTQLYTRVNSLGTVKPSAIMTKSGDRFTISEDQFAAMKSVMQFYK